MTCALRLLLSWAFGDPLRLERVQALTHPSNVASGRVLSRLGFRREGVLRGFRAPSDPADPSAAREDRRHEGDRRPEAPEGGRGSARCRWGAGVWHTIGNRRSRPVISITTKSPYALRALSELGRSGGAGPVPIGELARRRDIPVQFLEQLFAVLRRGGVLRSQRGVKGGYSFAREPASITVLEVVEMLDGPLGADAEGVFAEAAEAARKVLADTTIADIVEREAREAGAAMYYI